MNAFALPPTTGSTPQSPINPDVTAGSDWNSPSQSTVLGTFSDPNPFAMPSSSDSFELTAGLQSI